MPVQDAEVVVRSDDAVVVVQIPAEEMERGFVELLGLFQIAQSEVDPAETVVGVRQRTGEAPVAEVRVGALARAERLLVLAELDERAGALKLQPRDHLGMSLGGDSRACAGEIAERFGRVRLVDQGLRRLELERGRPGFAEPQALRGLDALVQVLKRREIAVGPKEDLGEIFEALEMTFGILREAGGRNRLLTLPNEVRRCLVHVAFPDAPGDGYVCLSVAPPARSLSTTRTRTRDPRTYRSKSGERSSMSCAVGLGAGSESRPANWPMPPSGRAS